ncbi:MAG: NADH-ubiquinone oxidoreductase complex I, 21 kDa subunit-domain-containing protein, partial [Piptocephalis tieghemiana]
YPVIDTDPTFGRVLRYARPSDYVAAVAVAAVGPGAFLALEHSNRSARNFRSLVPALKVAGFLGVCAGFLFSYQRVSQRFWGFRENEREQRMYAQEREEARAAGRPFHGTSELSPYMQRVAAGNSRFAALAFDALPWFNLVNHPYHGERVERIG